MLKGEGIPLSVLFVEDSSDDALLLVHELKRGGFLPRCERVETEDALKAMLLDRQWDLVITDHNMPKLDSHRAIHLIQGVTQDIPVIIVSGSIGEELAVEAMKAGANDYIMKTNLTRLVPAVKRELREAERRKDFRKAESTIHYLAYHDALTGLVNRHQFEKRLQRAIDNAKENDITHTLLYMDLDQFKIINDTSGHIAGDELLRCLAVALKNHIRERDTLARLGGDEFGVLLEVCSLQRGERIAEMLREIIQDFRFVWKDKTFTIGVSIGVVAIDAASSNIEDVLSSADMSCYAAKERGRNRIHVYRADDAELTLRQNEMQWVSNINWALEKNSFQLFQHRIVSLIDHHNIFFREFLVRMEDGRGKIIPPNAFIPAAERYNLMPSVDRWVIENGFRILAEDQGVNANKYPEVAFFNLSATSLSDNSCLDFICSQLKKYKLSPETICFEITETAAITDFRNAIEFIEGVKKMGGLVALDDFGTGMSTFSYLKRMPVDFIKIDGSFVRNMLQNPIDCSIVEAINNIGHVAGIKTIAEFVEHEAVKDKLRDIRIDYAQGFVIDTPSPVNRTDTLSQLLS